MSNKIRVLLGYSQIAVAYGTNMAAPALYQQFLRATSFLSGDVASASVDSFFPPVYCATHLDALTKLLVATVVPLGIALCTAICFGAVWLWLRFRGHPADALGVARVLVWAEYFVMFMTYPSICTAVYSALDCRQFGDAYYLRADYSVSCSNDRYRTYFVYACLCIPLFVVGIPILFALVLWRGQGRYTQYVSAAMTAPYVQPRYRYYETF